MSEVKFSLVKKRSLGLLVIQEEVKGWALVSQNLETIETNVGEDMWLIANKFSMCGTGSGVWGL